MGEGVAPMPPRSVAIGSGGGYRAVEHTEAPWKPLFVQTRRRRYYADPSIFKHYEPV